MTLYPIFIYQGVPWNNESKLFWPKFLKITRWSLDARASSYVIIVGICRGLCVWIMVVLTRNKGFLIRNLIERCSNTSAVEILILWTEVDILNVRFAPVKTLRSKQQKHVLWRFEVVYDIKYPH